MSIGQNMQPEIILWFGCVLKIDPAGVFHNINFIFKHITVGTFHHGENISNSDLKNVMGASQWVFVRCPKPMLYQDQVGRYEEMHQSKIGKG